MLAGKVSNTHGPMDADAFAILLKTIDAPLMQSAKCRATATLLIALGGGALCPRQAAMAEPVTVRYAEGLTHGFLELQTVGGKNIAWGESTQVVRGDRVTSRMVFRFTDGSLYDETTVFSQRGTFRLVSDRLIQKGPAFQQSMDRTIDLAKSEVAVRDRNKDGTEKVRTDRLELPPDLANGLLFTVVKDIPSRAPGATLPMVVSTPRPRIVQLEITPQRVDPFSVGNIKRKATCCVVKIKLGGVAGIIAPLLGKQPPDLHIWVVENEAPGFVRFEGPLEADGPVWRIQMASPAVFQSGH